jgi:hypothetical protein
VSTTSETELRAEIAWLEARNREVNLQRIEAETLARSQAALLDELERENARLREALKPFANVGGILADTSSRHGMNVSPEWNNGELFFVVGNGTAASLYRSQFDRALAALAGTENGR